MILLVKNSYPWAAFVNSTTVPKLIQANKVLAHYLQTLQETINIDSFSDSFNRFMSDIVCSVID